MKRMITVLVSLMLLLSLAAPALAEGGSPMVQVSGNATVALAADTAVIQLGVNTRKESVQEAQSENAALMNAVIEAIKAAGVAEKDVITSRFNVFSSYEYTSSLGREIRTRYYEVQNTVSVTIHDMSLIGKVLDDAVAAGANTSYGITFSSTEENEAYLKALARAYEDAEKKAQVLCAAAGKTLGELTLIDATRNSADYGILNMYNAKGTAEDARADTSILSGDVSVSATVTLEFAIK